jgi:hypothetical protein
VGLQPTVTIGKPLPGFVDAITYRCPVLKGLVNNRQWYSTRLFTINAVIEVYWEMQSIALKGRNI